MKLDFNFKRIAVTCCLLLLLVISPIKTFAAEVLQIRGPTTLQIGDRNRSYTVQLACIQVDSLKEKTSIDLLKKILSKKKKVNLKPRGSSNGILLARVISIEKDLDLSQVLYDEGVGTLTC